MADEKKGKRPDYKGDGIAIWINEDKNGKKYLSCKILNSINIVAFENIPKPTELKKPLLAQDFKL